jgi:hypothetical protein
MSGKETSVVIDAGKHKIGRRRSKTENIYEIDGVALGAVGKEVPSEVTNCLNIHPINVQRQFDPPYLLYSSPGEVSRHFNNIARINLIDEALQHIGKDIRSMSTSISSMKTDMQEKELALKEYDDLEEISSWLEKLEDMVASIGVNDETIRDCESLSEEIENTKAEIKENRQVLKNKDLINTAIGLLKNVEDIETSIKSASELRRKICKVQLDIKNTKKKIKNKKTVDKALTIIGNIESESGKLTKAERLMTDIVKLNKTQGLNNRKLYNMRKQLKEEFPEICPLCGNPSKADTISC